jgi:hypothetical protein
VGPAPHGGGHDRHGKYVGGLRDIAHRNKLKLWCENYGHWGFPGEFLIYGALCRRDRRRVLDHGPGDHRMPGRQLRRAYLRQARVYAEAFTSTLNLKEHPYTIKARGEELFCEGINHFVLHVYAHQPRDGMPGKNPWFGTAFHRNTPWFNQSATG